MDDTVTRGRAEYRRRVNDLAAFGHRGSSSHREGQAAAYLVQELQSLGLSAELQPFPGASRMGGRLLIPVLAAAVALAVGWWSALAEVLLAALALSALVHEQMTGRAWLSRPL